MKSWKRIKRQLTQDVLGGCVNAYYERVFKTMVEKGTLDLQGVSFDYGNWYEIDTITDLAAAEKLFNTTRGTLPDGSFIDRHPSIV